MLGAGQAPNKIKIDPYKARQTLIVLQLGILTPFGLRQQKCYNVAWGLLQATGRRRT